MGDRNMFGDSVRAKNPWALGTGPGKIAALAGPTGPQKQKAYRLEVLRSSRDAARVPSIWEKLNRDFGFHVCLCGRRLRFRKDNFHRAPNVRAGCVAAKAV